MTQLQHGRDGFIALLQSATAPAPVLHRQRPDRHSWRLPVPDAAIPATLENQKEPRGGCTSQPAF